MPEVTYGIFFFWLQDKEPFKHFRANEEVEVEQEMDS